jgi:acyl carrier protein
MDRAAILEKVIEVVRDTLDVEEGTTLGDATSFEDLGADSFDLLELVTALEDEFGLTFDDEILQKIKTIGDAVDAIVDAQ